MKAFKDTALSLATALTLAAAATGAQAGCFRCLPIQNVNDAAIAAPSGKRLSTEQIKASIIRAAGGLGWQVREAGPGRLIATLHLRKHTAEVEIPYTESVYSIIYKSSTNLDEADGQIHKNYNSWVQNLTKGINVQLGLV